MDRGAATVSDKGSLHTRCGALLPRLLLIGTTLTLIFSLLYLCTPPGKQFDVRATDMLLAFSDPSGTNEEAVTVNIDDDSLTQYGQWPWPRYRLAILLEKIQEAGAKTIAVNIIFPEPDRTSPIHWKKTLHHDLGFSVDTSSVPDILLDHDAYLANSLQKGNYVLGYELLFSTIVGNSEGCHLTETAVASPTDFQQAIDFHQPQQVLCNTETLNKVRLANGFFNGTPDSDGKLRRLPLFMEYKDAIHSSFALQTLFSSHNTPRLSIVSGPLGTRYLEPGRIPVDRRGNYILHGGEPSKAQHLSAAEILSGGVDTSLLRGKVVFVGLTASGLAQEYRLTAGNKVSMVDIHRLAYLSLSGGKHYTRGELFWLAELVTALALCTLLTVVICFLSTLWSSLLFSASLLLSGLAALYLVQQFGLLFSPILPWGCLLLNFFMLMLLKYKYQQRQSDLQAGSALQLLESSQETLQSILNTIPDIVFRLDKDGRIIFISSAVAKYKSFQTPLLGRSIFDLVLPEDRDRAQYRLNERRTGDRATSDFEIKLVFNLDQPGRKSRVRHFSVSAAGLYQNGGENSSKFIGTQGIVKDITARKEIESQLLRAKKMEAMGNLAAGIAHDLNNILSGLVSYPDMILADLDPKDPLYKQVSLIQKSGKKAAVIVQDLLTLARRNIQIDQVCNLSQLTKEYLESTEHRKALLRCPDIYIQENLAENGVNTLGSPVHLSKAIMNLINNGLEAMPDGGQIRVSTSRLTLSEHHLGYEKVPPGEYVCFTIEDTGIGIPADDMPQIFEPFFTKKPTAGKGTGLGMTIIWATIKDHNGFIDILSRVNRGTTITLYLPATEKTASTEEEVVSLSHYRGREHILIVDDIEEQLIIAKTMLERLQYTVYTALTPARALELLTQQEIDLVLLDMIMPGHMDGLETYREILRLRPNQKAIILSGYSESERVKKMQELGAGSYLQKPYSMESLARVVRQELDK